MSLERLSLPFDTNVVTQGQPVHYMYFLTKGEAKVLMERPKRMTSVMPPRGSFVNVVKNRDRGEVTFISAGENKDPEIIGDVELLYPFGEYLFTVTSTQASEFFSLSAENIERFREHRALVALIERLRTIAIRRVYRWMETRRDEPLPRQISSLISEHDSELESLQRARSFSVGANAKTKSRLKIEEKLSVKLRDPIPARGALVDIEGPGTWIHRRREQERKKMKRSRRNRVSTTGVDHDTEEDEDEGEEENDSAVAGKSEKEMSDNKLSRLEDRIKAFNISLPLDKDNASTGHVQAFKRPTELPMIPHRLPEASRDSLRSNKSEGSRRSKVSPEKQPNKL